MSILSPSPHRYFFATARVPFSISSPSPHRYFFSLALIPSSLTARTDARKFPAAVLCCSSKFSGTAEIVEELPTVASTSGSDYNATEPGHSRVFLDARTDEDILSVIRKEAENGKLPSTIAWGMKELYHNYRNAVIRSGVPDADKIVLSNMALTLDRIFKDVEDPFIFSPYHKAIREPFDYYVFAQNYIRPLIDFRTSYVGNISLFYEMQEKLQQGHNIILISNHQSEADPAVIALLLETTHPDIAQNVTYIAGDRVVTDPLCKPFSKGRNLLCVYSKKHMNDIPELAEMKKRANTRSLKEMTILLRGGSQIIWIAPSGGRDRPDPTTNEWYPAQFDASAVDNMRRLAEHSRVPGHIYPLALACYDIMPPPAQVEKEIGEKRLIGFHGTGLSAGPAINFHEIAAACGDSEESKMAYTEALYDSVVEQYNVLKGAIHGKRGLAASTASISLSQPWSQSVM